MCSDGQFLVSLGANSKFTVWIRLRRCLKYTFYVPCWICAMFHKLFWKETFVYYIWTFQTEGFQNSLAFTSWDKIKPLCSIKPLSFLIFPCPCLKESDSYLSKGYQTTRMLWERGRSPQLLHAGISACLATLGSIMWRIAVGRGALMEFHQSGKCPGMSQELHHKREDVLDIDTGCWRYSGLFGASIPI